MIVENFYELTDAQKTDVSVEGLKKLAAEFAVSLLEPGMVIGLGTGSTSKYAVEKIGKEISAGHLSGIVGIPSSVSTEKIARKAGISLSNFAANPVIDVNIDGADEADYELNLIKGGGGALLREKIVAEASQRNIIIIDESKLSDKVGAKWHLPIEVIPFAKDVVVNFLTELGGTPVLRLDTDGKPYETDNYNYILDTNFGVIEKPEELAAELKSKAGIVENGLFYQLATDLVIASAQGIRHVRRISE